MAGFLDEYLRPLGALSELVKDEDGYAAHLVDTDEATGGGTGFTGSKQHAIANNDRRVKKLTRHNRMSPEYTNDQGTTPQFIDWIKKEDENWRKWIQENEPRRPVDSSPVIDPMLAESPGTLDFYNRVANETPQERMAINQPASLPSVPVDPTNLDYTGSVGVPEYTPEYVAKAVADVEAGRYDPERIARDVAYTGMSIPMTALRTGLEVGNLATGGALDPLLNRYNEGTELVKNMVASQQYLDSERQVQDAIQRRDLDLLERTGGVLQALYENPLYTLSTAASAYGSMAVPAGIAKLANIAKGAKALAPYARFIPSAETASEIGNVAMNMGGTFSDEEMQKQSLANRYLGAGVSGLGTFGIGRVTEGGAEGQIARMIGNEGRQAEGTLLGSVGKESLQEGGEGASDYIGKALATGKDINVSDMIAEQIPDMIAGGIMGGGSHIGTRLANAGRAMQQAENQDVANQIADSASTGNLVGAVLNAVQKANPPAQQTAPKPQPKPVQQKAAEPAPAQQPIIEQPQAPVQASNPVDVIRSNGGLSRETLADMGWNDNDIAKLPSGIVADKGGMSLAQAQDVLAKSGNDNDVEALVDYASRPQYAPEQEEQAQPNIFGQTNEVPTDWKSWVDSQLQQNPVGQTESKQAEPAPVQAEQKPLTRADTQNRDRSSKQSIAQMNSIAGNPDYGRLGASNDFGNGAPVVYGDMDNVIEGNSGTMVASDGRRIPFRYGLVEADNLISSNLADGTPVPEYDTGAKGKLRAIAGNGRTAGIKEAYNRGTAGKYSTDIYSESNIHGISSSGNLRQPVLVRIMDEKDITPDLADVSNTATNAVLTPLEQAKNDARRIDISSLDFDEKGVSMKNVKDFIRSLPMSEQTALLAKNGEPTRQATDRLMAAVFATAYESDGLADLYMQSSDEDVSRNVLNALGTVAHKFAQMKDMGEFDIRPMVVRAAEDVINARKNGKNLTEYASNQDFTREPEADIILKMMATNIRSGKRIAEALENLADGMIGAYNAQGSMFGDSPTREQAFNNWRNNYGDEQRSEAGVPEQGRTEYAPENDAGEIQSERTQADTEATARPEQEEQPEEGLTLEQTTPEQIKADEEKAKAEAKRKADEAKKAEQKAKADEELGNFSLSGSDRQEDILIGQGQGSMFDNQGNVEKKAEQKPVGSAKVFKAEEDDNVVHVSDMATKEEQKELSKLRRTFAGSGSIGNRYIFKTAEDADAFISKANGTNETSGQTDKPIVESPRKGASYEELKKYIEDLNNKAIENARNGYGLPSEINTANVAQYFLEQFRDGKKYKSINEARKEVAALVGATKADQISKQYKAIDEAIELGVVLRSREIVEENRKNGVSALQTYRDLVELYKAQPNLGTRTSTSVAQQAYSTPVPLSYLASRIAGINENTVVYEPSAGNGALVIEASTKNVIANELNDDRAERLRSQGYEVTTNDGTVNEPSKTPQVVIANPPFGTIKVDGKNQTWTVLGLKTDQIDQAISLKAMDALPPDGRAVLIIGGKQGGEEQRSKKYGTKSQIQFYNTLYKNFNVVDHFSIDGKMYSRQGAGYPIDIIVVDGHRPTQDPVFPAGNVPRIYNSFEALEELINEYSNTDSSGIDTKSDAVHAENADKGRGRVSERDSSPDVRSADERGQEGQMAAGEERTGTASDVQPVSRNGQRKNRVGQETSAVRADGENAGRDGRSTSDNNAGERNDVSSKNGTDRTGERSDVRRNDAVSDTNGRGLVEQAEAKLKQKQKRKEAKATDTQRPYEPKSSARSLETLVPNNMQVPLQNALERVAEERGNTDAFVAEELGYKSIDELHNAFAAEQIDALALSLDNIKNGRGFILGDQTGIGKGRVCAGVIRWAKQQGKTPVFVTMLPDLYADMMRDLNDIGVTDFKPFITNTNIRGTKSLVAPDGSKLSAPPAKKYKSAIEQMKSGSMPDGYDAVFTSYSQLQSKKDKEGNLIINERNSALEALKDNVVLILDESHNAGGVDSSIGTWMRDYTTGMSNGVLYSSATFAKRPEIMSLYNKTDMSIVGDQKAIEEITQTGGLPMQQAISAMLSEAGQYVRREKSFEGAKMDTEQVSVDARTVDDMAGIMSKILEFSDKLQPYFKEWHESLKKKGSLLNDKGSSAKMGVESVNFSSLMHNIISQSTLSIKANQAVNAVEKAVKNGEKVVVTLSNTMGSAIESYAKENNLKPDDVINLSFKDLMTRYLEKCRTVKVTDSDLETVEMKVEPADAGDDVADLYEQAKGLIDSADLSALPISPIDYIIDELGKRGINVSEITGRKYAVSYKGKKPVLRMREASVAEKQKASSGFNNGGIDALVINKSGSTGISLHASEKFKDKRPRTMMILQPDLDIDVFMQTLGRVFRTGQVVPPTFRFILSDMPAEKRPAAVLGKKMASLNANTTASAKGSQTFDNIPDFLNVYGDMAALSVLQEDPELNRKLGTIIDEKALEGEIEDPSGLIRKMTGRIPLLTMKEQEDVYDRLTQAYNDNIEVANATGTNILDTTAKPLDAKLIKSQTYTEETDKNSPFGRESVAGVYDVKVLGKPFSSEEVRQHIEDGSKSAPVLTDLRKQSDEYIRKQKRGDKEMERLLKQQRHVMDVMRYFPVGETVRIYGATSSFDGVVVGYDFKGKPDSNPTAPSAWKITVDLPTAKRRITMPLSKVTTRSTEVKGDRLAFSNSGASPLNKMLSDFDNGQNEAREQRVIVTGNLVTAFRDSKGKGEIISFDTHDGKRLQGLMLNKGEGDLDAVLQNREITFRNTSQIMRFLRAGSGVMSRDGAVKLFTSRYDTVKIQVPASRKDGGKYFLDKGLTSIIGDFYKQGSYMVGDANNNLEKTVAYLTRQGIQFVPMENKELARQIVDGNSPAFSRNSPGTKTSIGNDEVQAVVDEFKAEYRNIPELVVADKPSDVSDKFPKDASGTFYRGKIYLFSSNIASREYAREVIVHEAIGHYGLNGFFGDRIRSVLADIFNHNENVRKAATEWRKKNKDVIRQVASLNKITGPNLAAWVNSRATEEAMAEMAQRGEKITGVKKLVYLIQRLLRAIGFGNLANRLEAKTDAEALMALKNAEMFAKSGISKDTVGATDIYASFARNQPISNQAQTAFDTTRKEFEVPDITRFENIRRAMQDRMIDSKKVIEAIRKDGGYVSERENVYQKEELYTSRLQNRIDKLDEEWVTPILDAAKDTGMTVEEIDQWLAARHILLDKVNERLADMNPNHPDKDRLSGMSDEEAQTVFHKGAGNKALYKVGELIDRLTRRNVQQRVVNGLMTQAEADQWTDAYKHYVPLKRDDGSNGGFGRTKGMEVKGAESKRRMGSTKGVVNVLANIFADSVNVAQRIEKARVTRSLLDLARNHPNDDFWTVDVPKKVMRVDRETGLVEMSYRDENLVPADNVVVVKENGKEHWITFNKNNERAMRIAHAMKNLDVEQVNGVIGAVGKITRYMGTWMTSKNPAFMFSNFLRDVQDAAFNLADTPISGKEVQLVRTIPSAMKAIWQLDRGTDNSNSEMARYAKEFREAGGETAFIENRGSIKEQSEALEKRLKELVNGKPTIRNVMETMGGVIENANNAVENSVRLATYVTARKNGLSRDRSASLAKNITVNFNRRGTSTGVINSLYLFANANIQGHTRMIQAMYKSRKARIVGGLLIGASFALSMLSRGLMGDAWDDVSPWEKENNWIFPINKNGDYIKIPIGPGLKLFHYAGTLLEDQIFSKERMSPIEVAMNLSLTIADNFNVAGAGSSPGQIISPTVSRPVVQMWENKKFNGSPIHAPSKDPFTGYEAPAYQKAFSTTPTHWTAVSRWLSNMTGGDSVVPGKVNVAPESIAFAIKSFAVPGTANEIDRVVTLAEQTMGKEKITVSPQMVPLVNRVYGHADEGRNMENMYKQISKWKQTIGEIRAYDKEHQNAMGYDQKFLRKKVNKHLGWSEKGTNHMADLGNGNQQVGALIFKNFKDFQSEMTDINKRIRAANSDGNRDEARRLTKLRKDTFLHFRETGKLKW